MDSVECEYIDVAGGVARVGGNESLYRRLLGKFEASVDIAGFDAAVAASDFSEAGKIVHTAKGVAGNLSMPAFYELCSELMAKIRSGGSLCEDDARRFRGVYRETLAAANAYLD
ncbi:MAG: Hpt domain-containing protein [Clostridiales Family XIII bacterium]|jgi:HPt (histidine-containing phosphotransfer) domain-containing protein|nr:Hpt domain-containing protein [Clostridiales Family XIII bacterium]